MLCKCFIIKKSFWVKLVRLLKNKRLYSIVYEIKISLYFMYDEVLLDKYKQKIQIIDKKNEIQSFDL